MYLSIYVCNIYVYVCTFMYIHMFNRVCIFLNLLTVQLLFCSCMYEFILFLGNNIKIMWFYIFFFLYEYVFLYLCMYECMSVGMYVCMFACININVCMNVCL